jgi:S1-C subfamily serine protease
VFAVALRQTRGVRGDLDARRAESGFAHVLLMVIVILSAVAIFMAVSNATTPKARRTTRRPAAAPARPAPSIDAASVASMVSPGVVGIDATLANGAHSSASGLLLTPSGEVLTSNHAIVGATEITVRAGDSGPSFAATVRGYDPAADVAVLDLADASGLPTVRLGDSATIASGESVVAIGRAAAATDDVTTQAGTITALHQQIEAGTAGAPAGLETLRDMLAFDAPTRPSDTGGAIADARGNVVAMITTAADGLRFRQQAAADASFAVPIDTVIGIADRIDAGASTADIHVGTGVTLGATFAATGDGAAVYASGVQPGSGAAAAGIAPGAVIVTIDGTSIATPADVATALNPHRPGQTAHVSWIDHAGVAYTSAVALVAGPPG